MQFIFQCSLCQLACSFSFHFTQHQLLCYLQPSYKQRVSCVQIPNSTFHKRHVHHNFQIHRGFTGSLWGKLSVSASGKPGVVSKLNPVGTQTSLTLKCPMVCQWFQSSIKINSQSFHCPFPKLFFHSGIKTTVLDNFFSVMHRASFPAASLLCSLSSFSTNAVAFLLRLSMPIWSC